MKSARLTGKPKWVLALSCGLVLASPLVWWELRQRNSDERTYRIGFGNQPPQHFPGKDGKPTGLVVELINEAARRRRIRLQWSMEPESSEAALKMNKVDLWPIMTIRPERKGVVYITDPYREDTICLLVRSTSVFTHLQDLGDARIAFDGEPLNVRLLHPHVPNAKLLVIESPKERVQAVCQQRVEAAYFDEYTAITTLLSGASCGQALRIMEAPELSGLLGVGATLEARPAADALRAEIGSMAEDGTLDRIASSWSSLFSRNLAIATQLARAQTRERWLIVGISCVGLLLLYTLWQAGRIRRALTSAREATVLKNQFLANMSHEIRTPMNAILGMTALATDTSDREEQAEYLNDVMRAGESLLALLNDILDFSKIEAGQLRFDHVKFDPGDVIREVCSLLTEGARTKGLTLTDQTPTPLSCKVWGDPARLRQAVVNLVGNAIKFTEMGRIDLEAAIDSESDHIIRVRFAVKDTGIGISKEAQQRIFESFVQADGSVTRKYGGTGLGLSISTELISRMGGELRVDSAPGRGSTFWFLLPFERVQEERRVNVCPQDISS
ncbi:MAG TPA: ATP-binding protein [Bryobacteraceae bacterium]|nr:ATP-binding protein [Bryobacteraceae bacterium]